MKILLVLLTTCILSFSVSLLRADSVDRRDTKLPDPNEIKESIIKFLKGADPFLQDSFNISIPNKDPQAEPFTVQLKNVNVSGFGNLEIPIFTIKLKFVNETERAKVLVFELKWQMNWTQLIAQTEYNTTGKLSGGGMDIFGDGSLRVQLEDAVFEGYIDLGQTKEEKHVYLHDLDFAIKLPIMNHTKIRITGLFGNEDLSEALSNITSVMAPWALEVFQPAVNLVLKPELQKLFTKFFGDLTLEEFIKKIQEIFSYY